MKMLAGLFEELPDKNVDEIIRIYLEQFDEGCPRIKVEENPKRRCYSDGHLYFLGPGRARHGFFRHSGDANHPPECLLNARSRLGGSYDYDFHYDCTPVAQLRKVYPSCHGQNGDACQNHVNIAPNDYVR